MPSLASPAKPLGGRVVIRQKSTSPMPPIPPPKAIDLNSSTRSTDQSSGQKLTRRAFHCDVVVEAEGEGLFTARASLTAETTNLLEQLGQPLAPLSTLPAPPPPSTSCPTTPSRRSTADGSDDEDNYASWSTQKRADMEKKLANLIEELVRTEKSYLFRIKALKQAYADPLRAFAKDSNTQIIPLYEAKNLFANIDLIVPAATLFLADLETMWMSGQGAMAIGDVCLRHFKDLKTFDPYRTYLSKQDENQKMFQEILKKFPGFSTYMDSTKYQTTGIGNIGLRELLMEPVQRIPRYTLLWQTMMKCMPPMSNQRAKLGEAMEIAARIARCDPDPQTVRATVMYCLERNVDGFPAKMFSSKRDYIDSLDVEDVPEGDNRLNTFSSRGMSTMSSGSTPSLSSAPSTSSSSTMPISPPHGQVAPLYCTLFLFDDSVMIVKRQSSAISGRRVTGLDDIQKMVKSGGGVSVLAKDGARRDKLSYKGVINVLDIIATDVGNGDFHLFFERPPMDQNDRGSMRAFRSYTAVHPPYSTALDAVAIRKDKLKFVQNLWAAQALARAKLEGRRSVPRVLESNSEVGLDDAGEPFGRAKCFWDVWDRSGWTEEARKAKVTIHIDEDGDAEDLPLLEESGPCMIIRLQPISGGLCRFSHRSLADDEEERTVIDTDSVPERIATTIHRYGIFKFRTSTNSAPTTPSSTTHRLRPSIAALDAISRNLFGTSSVSGKSGTSSDMSTSSKRPGFSRSTTMESNRYSTMSTSSDERKRMSVMSTSSDERKRLSRLSASPSKSDVEVLAATPYRGGDDMRQSEVDLNARLHLARKNSKSMAVLSPGPSRAGTRRSAHEDHRMSARSEGELRERAEEVREREALPPTAPLRIRKTPSPTKGLESDANFFTSPRALSPPPTVTPLSPRLQGPRPPAPKSPLAQRSPQPPVGIGSAHTKLRVVSGGGRRISGGREMVPLKAGDENEASPDTPTLSTKRQHSGDMLSPRKRSPTRSPLEPRQEQVDAPDITSFSKRPTSRRSSGGRTPRKTSSPFLTPRKISAASILSNHTATTVSTINDSPDIVMADYEDINAALDAMKQKMAESKVAAKRIKLEAHTLKKHLASDSRKSRAIASPGLHRTPSLPRSPQKRNMNRLLDGEISRKSDLDSMMMEDGARGLSSVADRLERVLREAAKDGEQAAILAARILQESAARRAQIGVLQNQLSHAKETDALVRQQLADVQVEVDTIYEAFNTELDGMFNDAQLPPTQAFETLQRDLKESKAKRNELALENLKLKRELEEANLQRAQWSKILRAQGML